MSKEIGTKLKQERQNKNLTIDDVAGMLKIRKYYLEMMEAGNFKELPGLAYTIGFIRSYSRLLGIDAEPLVDVLKSGDSSSIHSVNVGLASSRMESALPSRSTIMISLAALIAVYVGWSQFSQQSSEEQELKTKNPPVVIEKINIEETTTTEPVTEPAIKEKIDPEKTEPKAVKKEQKPEVEKLKMVSVVETDELADISAKVKASNYGSANIENAKIVIVAEEDSWVQLRNDDELLFSKVLLEGDKYYISNYNDKLLFDTGNAGGIYVVVEGQRLPSLGPKGKIIRDFMFTEDAIQELKASASEQ